MPKLKLTKKNIESAQYEGRNRNRFIIWDTEVKGLGLRVHPGGSKSFVVFYRNKENKQKTAGQDEIYQTVRRRRYYPCRRGH